MKETSDNKGIQKKYQLGKSNDKGEWNKEVGAEAE